MPVERSGVELSSSSSSEAGAFEGVEVVPGPGGSGGSAVDRSWLDDPRWAPQEPEPSAEVLARSAAVEAADVAAGWDGSDEVFVGEGEGARPSPEVEASYSSHAEVYEGIMSGALSASEARRLVRGLEGPGPFEPERPEPTTELVREEGELDFERGTKASQSDSFGEAVVTEETRESRSEQLRQKMWAQGDDAIDGIRTMGRSVQNLIPERLEPTGAHTRVPDQPVVREKRYDIDGGDAAVAATLGVALFVEAGRAIVRNYRADKKGNKDAGDR